MRWPSSVMVTPAHACGVVVRAVHVMPPSFEVYSRPPPMTAARRVPSALVAIALQLACGALLAAQVAPPSAETWMPPGLAAAAMRVPSADVAVAAQGCRVGVGSRGVQTV